MIRITTLVVSLAVLLVAACHRADRPANWGDYSLMFSRSAGQYWSNGSIAGQWAWSPQRGTASDISWGEPTTWPPPSAEKFLRSADGLWVLLDGFSNGQGLPTSNPQRVTAETLGDANCGRMTPITSEGGRQHYVKWNIPSEGYCLRAEGTISGRNSDNNSFTVHFIHTQQWSPPAPCANTYYSGRTCVAQHEQWWDDKEGHAFSKTLDRTQQIALGLGMAFTIRQTYPTNWAADGRYFWNW